MLVFRPEEYIGTFKGYAIFLKSTESTENYSEFIQAADEFTDLLWEKLKI